MIHYHGTPISGKNHVAATVLKNRHGFVSFAAPRQIKTVAEVCASFAVDNGAFTTWRLKKKYDPVKYYSWVDKWINHPGFDWALIPDVIDGDLQANKKLISEWPFSFSQGVPVFHLHEPLWWLEALASYFPRVAIGSSGEYSQIGTRLWWCRMTDIFNRVCVDGRPICKLHGLRMLDPKIFSAFPFSSCDSTNVAVNCTGSDRWKNYPPPNNETRGIVLAERIEAHTSAPEWRGADDAR